MEYYRLNPKYKYNRDVVKIEKGEEIDENWVMAHLGDNHEGIAHAVSTDMLKGDEVPDELDDVEECAVLIAKLLNHYFKAELYIEKEENADTNRNFKRTHKGGN